MPALHNPKWEAYCKHLVAGLNQSEAYAKAFKVPLARSAGVSASRLMKHPHVQQRLAELRTRVVHIEAKALERAIEKTAITKEAVLTELAKIGFADIRRAVRWGPGTAVRMPLGKGTGQDGDGNEVVVVEDVVLRSSEEIDDDTAAAIKAVKRTTTGLTIEFHDKQAALMAIGKELGMFVDRKEVGQPGAFDDLSDEELQSVILAEAERLRAEDADGAGGYPPTAH